MAGAKERVSLDVGLLMAGAKERERSELESRVTGLIAEIKENGDVPAFLEWCSLDD